MVNKLLFLLFITSLTCFSQEIELKGKITNATQVSGIHIMNQTSRRNSITNAEGDFIIQASKLDTLLISSIKYMPELVVVSEEFYNAGVIVIELKDLVNELDEVIVGHQLTGNMAVDVKNIKTEDAINFDDVGIPGFKGEPEEKIPALIGQVITPLSVNIEGLYKYMSGYYKTLRTQRKWQKENNTIARILTIYPSTFFEESYQIPEDRVYDFLLFCIESNSLQRDFNSENYVGVLGIFESLGKEYVSRLEKEE